MRGAKQVKVQRARQARPGSKPAYWRFCQDAGGFQHLCGVRYSQTSLTMCGERGYLESDTAPCDQHVCKACQDIGKIHHFVTVYESVIE